MCNKTAPKAIQWIVAIFHLFKTHLNPITINSQSSKVKQGWLQLYQNNLNPHSDPSSEASEPPHPPTLYTLNDEGTTDVAEDPPTWLTAALSIQNLPSLFQGEQILPPPLSSELLPLGTIKAIKLIFDDASPLYLDPQRQAALDLHHSQAWPGISLIQTPT
ncbi:hypothetical protein EDC04DRAFT_2899916 [Pisolithus marmoratus]|nr:hypothetical protein EDC04DRAFT_2899916 [Pisolithus marmoratus]